MLIRETTIAVSSPVCTALPVSDTPRNQTATDARSILRFPRTNRTTWYRLTCLAHHRGEHGEALQQFLAHATYEAGPRGRLADVPRLINTYKTARGISERSAWRALKAACQRGWIRCTQHAAPGYPARYELQVPVDLVVPGLPDDLAAELELWNEERLPEPDHADTYAGHLSQAPLAPVCLIPPTVPGPRTVPDTTPDTSIQTECQTSPYTATAGFSPLGETLTIPGGTSDAVNGTAWRPARRRQRPTAQELTAARQVLARCQPWWRHQRGRSGVLSAAELAGLVEPVALALRRSTPSELVAELTVQCRSARSLAHLVGHRAWRIIKTRTEWDQRRPAVLADGYRADDQGVEYARVVARRAAEQAPMATGLPRARTALRQGVHRVVETARAVEASAPAPQWHREDDQVHLAALAAVEEETAASALDVYRARVERSQRDRWTRDWRR
ncbi:hypothetical protein ACFC26_41315 [Kitasatospora purpeofusca]|uniref:hypothetical protein n=1 Tax=Kitasatospora purpeofusca TaxID=67352 RepID=UPI0035DC01BF